MRLTTFHSQFRAIGTNYNQCVRALKSNFSEKKALAFLYKLERHTPPTGRVKQADFRTGGGVPKQIPRPMIAKISHGSSLYGVLAYNQLKVDERHADVLFTSRIIEPQGDNPYTIGHLSRSFGDYLTANRKTEKPVLHISLNPDPKDCLSEERFVSLAEEYMRRMGFGDQPYIVYRHNDIGREHLHIVPVRVDETGRAISDSYQHGRSMKVCRELERQFGLVPATPKQWKEALPLLPVGYGDGNLKGQLAGNHPPARPGVAFPYRGEYRAVLSLYGITVDEVKGNTAGGSITGLT